MPSIICQSDNPMVSCDGLAIAAPPYTTKQPIISLECVGYGCTNIAVISEHGADDLSVTVTQCDCDEYGANGDSGNSCIGLINFECRDGEAVFDGIECEGYAECCGSVVNQTIDGRCGEKRGSKRLSNEEIEYIVFGVFFGVLLMLSLCCYCSNKYEKMKNAKGRNINFDEKVSGRYGAVKDEQDTF